jgi:GDPmannose 4,6-dehydratase
MVRIALISGISGQDGSYLTELLLSKDYVIWGIIRKSSSNEMVNLKHLMGEKRLILRYGDLSDGLRLVALLQEIKATHPDLERLEVYNLGALSHVKISFELPEYSGDINGLGVLRFLEAIRLSGYMEKIRFYQASTSELFGKVVEVPQTETTPFYPRSPYGVSKLYGFWITKNYRESYGIYACNGILFNHESPRRHETFVTRKVTAGLGDIVNGHTDRLVVGNLDASRDWGHAKDYVRGMWLMMQQETPDDFILCSSETHSVREFIEKTFKLKGFDIKWRGSGVNEIGYDNDTGRELVFVSEEFFRPAEVDLLVGDSTKARTTLKWKPEYTFDQLVAEMVVADC